MFAALDTNHFREVAQGADHAAAMERRATEAQLELFTTIITVQEATAGWLALINRLTAGREQIRAYERFQATITAFSKFDILPFDEDAANHFHRLQRTRVRIGTMDLKVASICLAHDTTLLTRNLVDFEKVPGLRVENWLD
jgi:tRNA(fMet)-specific endonuclease VapC